MVFSGPVQINVGRDLNIYGGASSAPEIPDDCVVPRGDSDSEWIVLKVVGVLLALAIGVPVVLGVAAAAALAVGCLALTALAFDIAAWMLGRIFDLYSLIERSCGGGPTRLIILSCLLRLRRQAECTDAEEPLLTPRRQCAPAVHQLGSGTRALVLGRVNESAAAERASKLAGCGGRDV
jgi:hypothetical protein